MCSISLDILVDQVVAPHIWLDKEIRLLMCHTEDQYDMAIL
jgi:hypothetical protein